MTQPAFTVRLADLERGKTHYDWELPLEWLRSAFEGTDAQVSQPGTLVFEASLTSRQVLIRGRASADVTMPCARTLDPIPVSLSAEVFLLLRPAPAATEHASHTGSLTKKPSKLAPTPSAAQAPKQKPTKRPESELSEQDAAEDVYYGDAVELDGFVREFLLLELPMMPLRSDLRSEERPAIPPTPETSEKVDPRLQPLAEIARRLGKKST